MPVIKKTVDFYKCTRCGYEWYPRQNVKPKTCPHCRSPYWDVPRKNQRKSTAQEVLKTNKSKSE